jgi:hypothetical protein
MSSKEQATPYPIRMPERLRAMLTKSAEQGNRSLHAEIIARLTASFDESAESDLHAAVAMIKADLEEIKRRTAARPTKKPRASR